MAQAKQMKPLKTRKSNFKFTRDLFDGLAKQNVVLMTGIVNAPVIIAATTFKKGVVIAIAFALISFLPYSWNSDTMNMFIYFSFKDFITVPNTADNVFFPELIF